VGLFLFTRIQIPDVMLTLTIRACPVGLLRALDEEEETGRDFGPPFLAPVWAPGFCSRVWLHGVSESGRRCCTLGLTKQLFSRRTWQRLRPMSGLVIVLIIAAPWHVLATVRNAPYFAWTLQSGPGQYHGFLWFYFVNEQLLRFLDLRYPHDYNTVPRLYFWLLHFLWLFSLVCCICPRS